MGQNEPPAGTPAALHLAETQDEQDTTMSAPAPTTTLPSLADVLELAELERPGWASRLLRLKRAGVPTNDGEPPKGEDPPKDEPKDEPKGKAGDPPKGDDDDDDAGMTPEQKVIARQRAEIKAMKDAKAEDERKAKAKSGQFEELYEAEKAKAADLEQKRTEERRAGIVERVAIRLNAVDPEDIARLMPADDLEAIDDAADAERAIKRLAKKKAHLFKPDGPRQKRDAGKKKDDDDDTDEDGKAKRPVNRLRAGIEAAQKERTGS